MSGSLFMRKGGYISTVNVHFLINLSNNRIIFFQKTYIFAESHTKNDDVAFLWNKGAQKLRQLCHRNHGMKLYFFCGIEGGGGGFQRVDVKFFPKYFQVLQHSVLLP